MWIFEPILKHTIWGGHRIARLKGLSSDDSSVGESWEISSIPGSVSVVSDGEDSGLTITQLVDKYKAELLGKENYSIYGNEFPLLIKFIDADKDLSIQVHPNDDMGRKYGHRGKTEMWYVVDAAADTRICTGFSRVVDECEYSELVKTGRIEDVVNRVGISKGELYYIPAGRIHAIGAGAFLVEVQQSSDVTYRVYDYMRRDANGVLRELHTELACEALDFKDLTPTAIPYHHHVNEQSQLLATPYFKTMLYDLTDEYTVDLSELDSFVALVVAEGECRISADDDVIEIKNGNTVLIGASSKSVRISPNTDRVVVISAWI